MRRWIVVHIRDFNLYQQVKDLIRQLKPVASALAHLESDSTTVADACRVWCELLNYNELKPHSAVVKKKKKAMEKKIKRTTRDRVKKWINEGEIEIYGILIECTYCFKWRIVFSYSEQKEVPDNWHCSMSIGKNGKKIKCSDPAELFREVTISFRPGELVWAKHTNYPWWPGMVDMDPDIENFFEAYDNGEIWYHVTFLDKNPTRAWLPENSIWPFSVLIPGKNKKMQFNSRILKAKKRALEAKELTIQERMKKYSFVMTFKGPWPLVESEDEESKMEVEETHETCPVSSAAGNSFSVGEGTSVSVASEENNLNNSAEVTAAEKPIKNNSRSRRARASRIKANGSHQGNKKNIDLKKKVKIGKKKPKMSCPFLKK
ncbi:zinc finger CW-type PWWP domain protein 1 [Nephila pilipes]|uniref:Zinc finger CW-type PWWP domain protein 1 n=1 Tax=Nephila pilipes TaxID=299642 RepID=A0A8X6NEH1_NEPPI|nr:zinc finger CW-type PWWP domain protein 1 [Nephila pilipes]